MHGSGEERRLMVQLSVVAKVRLCADSPLGQFPCSGARSLPKGPQRAPDAHAGG